MYIIVTNYNIIKLNKNNLKHETIIYEMATLDLYEWAEKMAMRHYR